jgi:hypothetical protein
VAQEIANILYEDPDANLFKAMTDFLPEIVLDSDKIDFDPTMPESFHPRSLDSRRDVCGKSPEHDTNHREADESTGGGSSA